MNFRFIFIILPLIWTQTAVADGTPDQHFADKTNAFDHLDLPPRPDTAMEGSAFADHITPMSLENREVAIAEAILSGNVPSFSRKLKEISFIKTIDSEQYEVRFYTPCDYLAVGSEQDYLYVPLTPLTAQYLAEQLGCTLPTKKMVDVIYNRAGTKLYPQPIPPSDKMTTVPVFMQHTDSVKLQISQTGYDRTADSLIAGHKKDVIISNKIYSPDRNYDRVVIYGWHRSVNNPIQPVYNGHSATYADYSHGIRLPFDITLVNGDSLRISELLKDDQLSALFSDEGAIKKPYYPPSDFFTSIKPWQYHVPIEPELFQNFPNPFNPQTIISYLLYQPAYVNLTVYNVLGQEVTVLIDENQSAGHHSVGFDASNLSDGTYYYRMKTGAFAQTKKMLILR